MHPLGKSRFGCVSCDESFAVLLFGGPGNWKVAGSRRTLEFIILSQSRVRRLSKRPVDIFETRFEYLFSHFVPQNDVSKGLA